MLKSTLVGVAVAVAILIAAGAARAADYTVLMCIDYINTTQDVLNGAGKPETCEGSGITIGGRNSVKTCDSLNSKLNTGITKLNHSKPEDAFRALDDFVAKVITLNTPNAKGQTKISGDDVDALITAGEVARDCTECLAFGC